MPPSIDVTAREPSPDQPSKAKRVVRYLFHLLHFSIGILLLLIVIFSVFSTSPFILYLLPLVIHILIVEICRLCHFRPPKKLTEGSGFLTPDVLRRRSFVYQLAGAYGIGWSGRNVLVLAFSITVWIVGSILFTVALVAREYDIEDWVQDPPQDKEGEIRLSDEESVIDNIPGSPRAES
jgi:hypothetical protein